MYIALMVQKLQCSMYFNTYSSRIQPDKIPQLIGNTWSVRKELHISSCVKICNCSTQTNIDTWNAGIGFTLEKSGFFSFLKFQCLLHELFNQYQQCLYLGQKKKKFVCPYYRGSWKSMVGRSDFLFLFYWFFSKEKSAWKQIQQR